MAFNGDEDEGKAKPNSTLSKGSSVGHYRIIEKIGAGGMGHVSAWVSPVLQASFTRLLANPRIGDLV
jgi:hypothetical protein